MKLTDHQWRVIEPLLSELRKREDGRGRPWIESRSILDGIFWILRSGARWKDMPSELPPYQAYDSVHWMNKFNPNLEWNSLLLTRQSAQANGLRTKEHSGATLDDGE